MFPRKFGRSRERPRRVAINNRELTRRGGTAGLLEEGEKVVEIPVQILGILGQLEEAQRNRRREEIMENMEKIHERVFAALKHYGMSPTIEVTPFEMHMLNLPGPGFNPLKKKEELKYKKDIFELISTFTNHSAERKRLLHEIHDWFESNDMADVPTDEQLEEVGNFLKESPQTIKSIFEHTSNVAEEMKRLGYKLLKEAGYLDSDDEDGSSGRPRRRTNVVSAIKTIFDEGQLLSDPMNLQLALDEVKGVLDQGVRMVKTSQQKAVFRSAVKQYKFILKALQMRFTESSEKDETILQMEVEIDTLKNANNRLEQDVAKKERKINKLDADIANMETKVNQLESQRAVLQQEKESLEQAAQALQAAQASPRASKSSFQPSVSFVSLKRESTKIRISESNTETVALRAELEEVRNSLEEEMTRSANLEKALQEQMEKLSILEAQQQLEEDLKEEEAALQEKLEQEMPNVQMRSLADSSDSLDRQVARLMSELQCKNELINYQESCLRNMREELQLLDQDASPQGEKAESKDKAQEMKRMVVRMRKDHEAELTRLKTHAEKEKQRAEATIRRMEQSHQEQLSNVHKQSIHLLRAINRFKGTVAVILDREDLPAAANDVRLIPNLPTDDAPSDTRLLLAQMAGNAVELLVTIEFKLSQSLLNKRLEVKDNSFARKFANKDLQLQVTASNRAKQTAESLHEKLKATKKKLAESEAGLISLRKQQEKRFDELMTRNHQLMSHYKAIQKQMSTMKADCGESLRNKERQLTEMKDQSSTLAKTVEEQQTTIYQMHTQLKQRIVEVDERYQLSMTDQHANLKVLQAALAEGLITQEMHSLTVRVIKQFMDLPLLRLRVMIDRYVAYRRLTDAKAQLEKQMTKDLVSTRRKDLNAFLDRVDEQLTTVNEKWQEKQEQLKLQRQELFTQFEQVFTETISMSSLLSIQPCPQPARDDGPCEGRQSPAAKAVRRTSVPPAHLPPIVPPTMVGTSMPIGGTAEPMWKLPPLQSGSPIPPHRTKAWQVPRMLDMDINQRMRRAQRLLQHTTKRQSMSMPTVEGYDYEECVVRSLQELFLCEDHRPPQRPTTPTATIYVNQHCQCGSICSSVCHKSRN